MDNFIVSEKGCGYTSSEWERLQRKLTPGKLGAPARRGLADSLPILNRSPRANIMAQSPSHPQGSSTRPPFSLPTTKGIHQDSPSSSSKPRSPTLQRLGLPHSALSPTVEGIGTLHRQPYSPEQPYVVSLIPYNLSRLSPQRRKTVAALEPSALQVLQRFAPLPLEHVFFNAAPPSPPAYAPSSARLRFPQGSPSSFSSISSFTSASPSPPSAKTLPPKSSTTAPRASAPNDPPPPRQPRQSPTVSRTVSKPFLSPPPPPSPPPIRVLVPTQKDEPVSAPAPLPPLPSSPPPPPPTMTKLVSKEEGRQSMNSVGLAQKSSVGLTTKPPPEAVVKRSSTPTSSPLPSSVPAKSSPPVPDPRISSPTISKESQAVFLQCLVAVKERDRGLLKAALRTAEEGGTQGADVDSARKVLAEIEEERRVAKAAKKRDLEGGEGGQGTQQSLPTPQPAEETGVGLEEGVDLEKQKRKAAKALKRALAEAELGPLAEALERFKTLEMSGEDGYSEAYREGKDKLKALKKDIKARSAV